MAEKTLSSGTLGLRFMRNARRAQNPPHVRPEHAPATDDAEWHVSPEPSKKSAYHDQKPVTYETSYLPFLFPSLHDTPTADAPSSSSPLPPRGRRAFDKRGHEITQASNIDREVTEHAQKSQPHSISLIPRQPKKSTKDPSNDAKSAIFDMSAVGTDLRQSSSIQGTEFLRPAGVDAPTHSAKTSRPAKTALQSATGTTASPKPKMKRSRTSGNADKSIKKTRLELIE